MPLKGIGGDFFTWQRSGETIELTVADVMGKGTSAALMAATVRATLNALKAPTPSSLLHSAAEVLAADFEATGIFATLFHARLDMPTGLLTYTDAGHGLNLIVRSDGTHEQLEAAGLPLGLELGMPRADQQTALAPGDTLLSFTDGLLDFYGGTQSALKAVAALIAEHREPASIVEAVRDAASHAGVDDDISMVAIHRP
ncbi:PP2C family protein-serine/threonine phosphatase [Sinomonas susongensis]|uniref:PP2C family protein-serine/threonine phosphatase n=1 Tax=Sinomonas susongensis TaxID=1324851 RepID=UPI00319E66BC